jgi:hypothetical protein
MNGFTIMADIKSVLKMYGACSQPSLVRHLEDRGVDLTACDIPSLLRYASELSGELRICVGARNKILYALK